MRKILVPLALVLAACGGKTVGLAPPPPDAGHGRVQDAGLAARCTRDADCDDGFACTADFCDPANGCQHVANDSACDDGVACTTDRCDLAQGCLHTADDRACDDGVDCTADSCDATRGCLHAPHSEACDDQSPCTDDVCDPAQGCQHRERAAGTACDNDTLCDGRETCAAGGICRPGSPLDCDDHNPCTADACDPVNGCTHTPVSDGLGCDDGDLCNGHETCQQGLCKPGSALTCTSTDPCQGAACDPVQGCTLQPLSGVSCDDGDVCNGTDSCVSGSCVHSGALPCQPVDACHSASCSPTQGCVQTPLTGTSCDDGNSCNGADTCQNGTCTHDGPVQCSPIDACHAAQCQAGSGCVQVPLTGTSCNDNDVCNGADTCQSGVCTHSGPLDCQPVDACHSASCNPSQGCVQTALTGTSCDDGNVCNGPDTCQAGVCQHGTALDCDDGNLCTTDGCNPSTGCVHGAVVCNDGIGCTVDTCKPDAGCVATPDDTRCDGGVACNQGMCVPGYGDPVSGCAFFASNSACDDAVACTGDYCDPSFGCSHVTQNTRCDDGLSSTRDVCSTGSGCSHPSPGCTAKQPAYELPANGFLLITGVTDGGTDSATALWDDAGCDPSAGSPDVIVSMDLPNYSKVTLDTTPLPDGGGTNFDTVVFARTSCAGSATQLGCSDDVAGTVQSKLVLNLGPGQYYGFVDGWSPTSQGRFALKATVQPIDTCANPKDVGAGGTFSGNTLGLTDDYQSGTNAGCSGGGFGNDAVFKATVPAGKTKMRVTTQGSSINTLVYVRSTCSNTAADLACSDGLVDARGNYVADYVDFTVNVTAGQSYYVFMDCYAGTDGPWVLRVSFL